MTEKLIQKERDFIGCSIEQSPKECVHGDSDNLDSLKDKRKITISNGTEKYIQLLMEVIEKEPLQIWL